MNALENIVVTPSRRPLKFQVTDTSIHFLCFDNAISRDERVVFFMSLFVLKRSLIDRLVLTTYKDAAYAPDAYVEVRVINSVQHPAYGQAGLFARRAIPTNTIVTPYSGFIEALHTAVNSRTYTMGYGTNDADGLALDAEFVGNFARFANDPRGVEGGSANIAAESRYTARGEVYTALVARRPIAAGEEILMSYGKEHRLTEAPWMDAVGVPLMRPRIMAAAPFPLLAAPNGGAPPVAHQLVWQCVQCGFWSLTTTIATVGAAAVERCCGCSAPRLTQSRLVSVLAVPPLADSKTRQLQEQGKEEEEEKKGAKTLSVPVPFKAEERGDHPDVSASASFCSSSSDDEEGDSSTEWWEAEQRPIRARTEAKSCTSPVCAPAPAPVAAVAPRKRGRPPKVKTSEATETVAPAKRSHKKKLPPRQDEGEGNMVRIAASGGEAPPKRSHKKKKAPTEIALADGAGAPPKRSHRKKVRPEEDGGSSPPTEHIDAKKLSRMEQEQLEPPLPKRRGRPSKKTVMSTPAEAEHSTAIHTESRVEKSQMQRETDSELLSTRETAGTETPAERPTNAIVLTVTQKEQAPRVESPKQRARLMGRPIEPREQASVQEGAKEVAPAQPNRERKSEYSYEKRKLDSRIRRAVLQKIEQMTSAPSSPCRLVSPSSPRPPSNLTAQGVPVAWPMSLPFLCWQVWDPALPLQVATSRYSKFVLSRYVFVYHVSTRVKETKAAPLSLKIEVEVDDNENDDDTAVETKTDVKRRLDPHPFPTAHEPTGTTVKEEEKEKEDAVAEDVDPHDTADLTLEEEEEEGEEEGEEEATVTVAPHHGRRGRLRLKADHMWTPNVEHAPERGGTPVPEGKREEPTPPEEADPNSPGSRHSVAAADDSVEGQLVQRLYLSYQEHNPLLTALAPESSTGFLDRFVLLPAAGAVPPLDAPRVIQEVVLHAHQRVYTAKSFKPGEVVQSVGGIIRRRHDTRDRPSYSPLSIPLLYMVPRACRLSVRAKAAPEGTEKDGDIKLMRDFVHRCRELELVVTNEFMYCPCFAVMDQDADTKVGAPGVSPMGTSSAAEEVEALLRRTCNVVLLLSVDAQGSPFVAAVATRPIAAYEPLLACTQ